MDLALTDEQRMMIETVRRFIRQELQSLEEEVERSDGIAPEAARAIYAKSKGAQPVRAQLPQEFGGGGLSTVDRMLCEEQFGRTTDILVRRAFGDVFDALLACRGEQVDRWLKPVVSGERICALAITEPGAGSDAH